MNESDMPREWWGAQDQDDAWVKQQEEEMQRREEEARNAPVQLELPLDGPINEELEQEYDAFMARLEEEGKRHGS